MGDPAPLGGLHCIREEGGPRELDLGSRHDPKGALHRPAPLVALVALVARCRARCSALVLPAPRQESGPGPQSTALGAAPPAERSRLQTVRELLAQTSSPPPPPMVAMTSPATNQRILSLLRFFASGVRAHAGCLPCGCKDLALGLQLWCLGSSGLEKLLRVRVQRQESRLCTQGDGPQGH